MQLKTINMPRQACKTSVTGIYHVMQRGINRQDIFEDDEDYMKFLQSLQTGISYGIIQRVVTDRSPLI